MFRLFGVVMITLWIGIVESRVSRLTPIRSDVTLRVNGKGFDKYEQVEQAFEAEKQKEEKKGKEFKDKMPKFKDLSDLWQAANIMSNVMHSQKKKEGTPYGMFVRGIKSEASLRKFSSPDENGKFGHKNDPGKLIKDSPKKVPAGSKALFINLPPGIIEGYEKWSWIFLNKDESISEKLGLKVYEDKPFPNIFVFREKDITPEGKVARAKKQLKKLGLKAQEWDFDDDKLDYYYDDVDYNGNYYYDNDDKYSRNQRALNRLINAYNAIDES